MLVNIFLLSVVPTQTLVFLSVKTVGNRVIQLLVTNYISLDTTNTMDLIILSIIGRWHDVAKKIPK